MTIQFEVGKESANDSKPANLPEANVAGELSEKEVLQNILLDAGVEFKAQLGVAKLRLLVDALPKDEVAVDPQDLVE